MERLDGAQRTRSQIFDFLLKLFNAALGNRRNAQMRSQPQWNKVERSAGGVNNRNSNET